MKPSEFYESLLAQINDETEKAVFEALSGLIGQRVSRVDLVMIVFGHGVNPDELSQDADDRKIRKCIEALRLKGFPIIASSGESGYALVDDPALMDGYIAEEMARIQHIQAKIDVLRRGRQFAKSLHEWREATQMAIQSTMF